MQNQLFNQILPNFINLGLGKADIELIMSLKEKYKMQLSQEFCYNIAKEVIKDYHCKENLLQKMAPIQTAKEYAVMAVLF